MLTSRFRVKKLQNPLLCRLLSNYREAEEIRIPVPYGHIAGKVWGEPDGKPILGLHGWLDNAATYDRIAPLLAPGYRLVCFDQIGHGLSSHFPPGMHYKLSDTFHFVNKILQFLKWEKCIIMGHSLGGGIASWYSALFPEQVEKLISIDLISFGAMPLHKHVGVSRKSVLESVRVENKINSDKLPYYSFEDACGRAFMAANVTNGLGSITKESVETLLKRGLIKKTDEEDMYTWAYDLRLRIPMTFNLVQEVAEEYASKISSPHLFIKASDSNKYMTDENFQRLLKVYRNNNPNFVYREVEGGHYLHLNTPDKVAVLINQFLERKFDNPDPEKS